MVDTRQLWELHSKHIDRSHIPRHFCYESVCIVFRQNFWQQLRHRNWTQLWVHFFSIIGMSDKKLNLPIQKNIAVLLRHQAKCEQYFSDGANHTNARLALWWFQDYSQGQTGHSRSLWPYFLHHYLREQMGRLFLFLWVWSPFFQCSWTVWTIFSALCFINKFDHLHFSFPPMPPFDISISNRSIIVVKPIFVNY